MSVGTPQRVRGEAYSQELQRAGKGAHIWRIVGEYSNDSVFEVAGGDERHTILSNLLLFSYVDIHLTRLATHPSDIEG